METSTEYRRFAQECHRLAREAKTERHRQIMEEMAQAWERLAKETDRGHAPPSAASPSASWSCPCPARRSHTCAICNKLARAFGSWSALAISKHSAA